MSSNDQDLAHARGDAPDGEGTTRLTGGCLCGQLRYAIESAIPMRALCLCRTCQKISGGQGNLFIGVAEREFSYLSGEPRRFAMPDRDHPTVRDFCGTCGVHIAARSPKAPGGLIVKQGTLDEPSLAGAPKMVFWAREKLEFHVIPHDCVVFQSIPRKD